MPKESMFQAEQPESVERAEPQEDRPYRFRILYSAHEGDSFWTVEELTKELQDADIWFPEQLGLTDDYNEKMKLFATGKYIIPNSIEPHLKVELEALRNVARSGKEVGVGFVDIPDDHHLMKRYNKDFSEVALDYFKGKFLFAITKLKSSISSQASAEKSREEYMQEGIDSKIQEILEEHPRLKEKFEHGQKLNVLMTLGTFHTGVSHGLTQKGENVERRFNHEMPFTFSPLHELMRRYRFKKEATDELAAQALFHFILRPEFDFLPDLNLADKIVGKISRGVSLEMVKEISERLGSGHSLNQALNAVHIKIPRSVEEVKEMSLDK